jgi:DNA-binding IclR family transcriptional regulator
MRHGTVMSLRGTASGRLFAAFLPRATVQAAAGDEAFSAAFERELAAIRKQGLSHAVDASVPGVSALAAPVFDGSGSIVLSLTAIGVSASFDVSALGAPAQALQRCAAELSSQLGAGKI